MYFSLIHGQTTRSKILSCFRGGEYDERKPEEQSAEKRKPEEQSAEGFSAEEQRE